MKLLQPILLTGLLLCATTALAQNRTEIAGDASCQQLRPSDPPCPAAESSDSSARGDLRDRTHSMLLPTGNLLGKGETQMQLNELAIYDRVAYGVSDRVELSVGMIIPSAVNAGLKIALIEPTGPFRLVAGATIWKGAASSFESRTLMQGGVTAAYQTEAINLHASIELIESPQRHEDVFAAYSVGGLLRVSSKLAVSAELLRLTMLADECCTEGVLVGAKLMGESWDFDLGIATPLEQQSSSLMFPILAASTKL